MIVLRWPGPGTAVLLQRARRLRDAPGRAVLGLVGAPASGKSTLADELAATLGAERPGAVVVVGMDAFHLGHRVLQRHGLVGVKGAPHTFDADGYVALLERVRAGRGTVYAPEFQRAIEDSLAHVVEIGPEVSLVITEGNYLLLPDPPWAAVRPLLDEAWFVRLDEDERRRRLVARHERYGRTTAEAWQRTLGSDEDNAVVVAGSLRPDHPRLAPDVLVEQDGPATAAVSAERGSGLG